MRTNFVASALLAVSAVAASGCLPAFYPSKSKTMSDLEMQVNEQFVLQRLVQIGIVEEAYASERDRFLTMDELVQHGMLEPWPEDKTGYGCTLTLTKGGRGFEIVAVPVSYALTGRRSFFLDETGVVRGANHNGDPATASDPVVWSPSREPSGPDEYPSEVILPER